VVGQADVDRRRQHQATDLRRLGERFERHPLTDANLQRLPEKAVQPEAARLRLGVNPHSGGESAAAGARQPDPVSVADAERGRREAGQKGQAARRSR